MHAATAGRCCKPRVSHQSPPTTRFQPSRVKSDTIDSRTRIPPPTTIPPEWAKWTTRMGRYVHTPTHHGRGRHQEEENEGDWENQGQEENTSFNLSTCQPVHDGFPILPSQTCCLSPPLPLFTAARAVAVNTTNPIAANPIPTIHPVPRTNWFLALASSFEDNESHSIESHPSCSLLPRSTLTTPSPPASQDADPAPRLLRTAADGHGRRIASPGLQLSRPLPATRRPLSLCVFVLLCISHACCVASPTYSFYSILDFSNPSRSSRWEGG